jgi:hypothetical protein
LIFAITYLIEKVVHHYFPKGDNVEGLSFKRFAFAIKTFIIVTIAWVFFRSDSIHDAFGMFDFFLNSDGVGALEIKNYVWVFLGLFLLTDILLFNKRFDEWVGNKPMAIRWATYFTLIFSIIVFAGVEDFAFIYFQF